MDSVSVDFPQKGELNGHRTRPTRRFFSVLLPRDHARGVPGPTSSSPPATSVSNSGRKASELGSELATDFDQTLAEELAVLESAVQLGGLL